MIHIFIFFLFATTRFIFLPLYRCSTSVEVKLYTLSFLQPSIYFNYFNDYFAIIIEGCILLLVWMGIFYYL